MDPVAPELDALLAAANQLADAMRQPRPDVTRARTFFTDVLHTPQGQGGRDLWGCFSNGLITEVELRDATMARLATWLSHLNGTREPSSQTYNSAELELSFEVALLGRAAAR